MDCLYFQCAIVISTRWHWRSLRGYWIEDTREAGYCVWQWWHQYNCIVDSSEVGTAALDTVIRPQKLGKIAETVPALFFNSMYFQQTVTMWEKFMYMYIAWRHSLTFQCLVCVLVIFKHGFQLPKHFWDAVGCFRSALLIQFNSIDSQIHVHVDGHCNHTALWHYRTRTPS